MFLSDGWNAGEMVLFAGVAAFLSLCFAEAIRLAWRKAEPGRVYPLSRLGEDVMDTPDDDFPI